MGFYDSGHPVREDNGMILRNSHPSFFCCQGREAVHGGYVSILEAATWDRLFGNSQRTSMAE